MYCTKCGGPITEGAVFCTKCGQALLSTAGDVQPRTMSVPVSAPVYAAGPRVEYAGFWLRFLAYAIDSFVMGFAVIAIVIPLIFLTGLRTFIGGMHPREEINDGGIFLLVGVFLILMIVGLAVTWLYHALMESSEWQATVGKKALGLVVTDMAGQRVSFGRSTGRHFGKILTNMIPVFLGYVMAGFTEKRQALHDMIAGCLVLRRS